MRAVGERQAPFLKLKSYTCLPLQLPLPLPLPCQVILPANQNMPLLSIFNTSGCKGAISLLEQRIIKAVEMSLAKVLSWRLKLNVIQRQYK